MPNRERVEFARKAAVTGLRVAPWVVFGPISGFLCERAFQAARRKEPILAGLYLILNVAILALIPILTAAIAANI